MKNLHASTMDLRLWSARAPARARGDAGRRAAFKQSFGRR